MGAGKKRYHSGHIAKRKQTSNFRSPKVYSRKLKAPRKRLNLTLSAGLLGKIIVGLAVLTGIFLLFFSSYFKISEVMVEGAKTVNANEIKSFIPKGRNLILLKTDPIKDKIQKKYPQIKEIAVLKGLPNAVKIQIVEREGRLVWLTTGKRYLIDPEGVVSREVSEAESAGIPVVADAKNITVSENQLLLSPDFIAFVSYLDQYFYEKTNLKPSGYFVDETTYDLSVTTDANIKIMFETVRSPESQLENLKKILANYRDQIHEYIDLRVEGWGYYK